MVTAKGGGEEADSAPRRGRPRSIETTNAILESAYALMAATGATVTTIDAVARHSNVSKMTIYKWWPSREALLIDAFLHHAAQMLPLPPVGLPAAPRRVRVVMLRPMPRRFRASSEKCSLPSSPNASPGPARRSYSTHAICNCVATRWSR
ncbi:AcrR family transcriptional regulator [Bradyrhizobium sp. LM2.7]